MLEYFERYLNMKKSFVKFFALMLVALTLCIVVSSCAQTVSGKYEGLVMGTGITLEFSGKDVTITPNLVGYSGEPIKGSYSIKDGKINIKLSEDGSEIKLDNLIKKAVEKVIGEQTFEQTDDGIKIGNMSYNKVD